MPDFRILDCYLEVLVAKTDCILIKNTLSNYFQLFTLFMGISHKQLSIYSKGVLSSGK